MSAITGIGDSRRSSSAPRRRRRAARPRARGPPASATVRIWSIVACRLAVSVFVIVCTTTGAPPPMRTPPTSIPGRKPWHPVYESTVVTDDAAVNKRRSSQAPAPAAGDTLPPVVCHAPHRAAPRVRRGRRRHRRGAAAHVRIRRFAPVRGHPRGRGAAGDDRAGARRGAGLSPPRRAVRAARLGHRAQRRRVARRSCVVIALSKMRRILDVDLENQRVVVQPGVLNLWVTQKVAPHGYSHAPDPSSQQVCSIGGNVAENSGGVHCLKYGFTINHVLGIDAGHARRRCGRDRRGGGRDAQATTWPASSSAPRARSAFAPRSRCGSCGGPRRSAARWSRSSRRSTRRATRSPRSSARG